MIDFVKRGLTSFLGSIVAGSTRQKTENASRSTSALNEQISSVKGLGSMSNLRWTKYVVVPLRRASSSMGVPGFKNVVTSAMWTPISISSSPSTPSFLGTTTAESASSISRHPGGSTEQTRRFRRSSRLGSSMCSSVTFHGSGGTHLCTAGAKGRSSTSASSNNAAVSDAVSPISPRARTKCPSGYGEDASHASMTTTILWEAIWCACRVLIRIFGVLRSFGTQRTLFARPPPSSVSFSLLFSCCFLARSAQDSISRAHAYPRSLQFRFTILTTFAFNSVKEGGISAPAFADASSTEATSSDAFTIGASETTLSSSLTSSFSLSSSSSSSSIISIPTTSPSIALFMRWRPSIFTSSVSSPTSTYAENGEYGEHLILPSLYLPAETPLSYCAFVKCSGKAVNPPLAVELLFLLFISVLLMEAFVVVVVFFA